MSNAIQFSLTEHNAVVVSTLGTCIDGNQRNLCHDKDTPFDTGGSLNGRKTAIFESMTPECCWRSFELHNRLLVITGMALPATTVSLCNVINSFVLRPGGVSQTFISPMLFLFVLIPLCAELADRATRQNGVSNAWGALQLRRCDNDDCCGHKNIFAQNTWRSISLIAF